MSLEGFSMRCFDNTHDSIDFGGSRLTDAELATANLTGIRKLSLRMTDVSDAGLKTVGGFGGLQYLDISQNSIGDLGLSRLNGLRNLRTLLIDSTQITNAGLEVLRTMPWLTRIDLDFIACLLYTSPSPRDRQKSRMPSSA